MRRRTPQRRGLLDATALDVRADHLDRPLFGETASSTALSGWALSRGSPAPAAVPSPRPPRYTAKRAWPPRAVLQRIVEDDEIFDRERVVHRHLARLGDTRIRPLTDDETSGRSARARWSRLHHLPLAPPPPSRVRTVAAMAVVGGFISRPQDRWVRPRLGQFVRLWMRALAAPDQRPRSRPPEGTPPEGRWTSAVLTTQPYPSRCERRRLRRALTQVSHPGGVEFLDAGQQPPVLTLRRHRYRPQRPAQFGE